MAYGVKQHQQPMEIKMSKLTKTQRTLLEAAAVKPEGLIILPDNIKGGAAKKVINGLLSKDLAAKDDNGVMRITDTGYHSIGLEPPKPEVKEELEAEKIPVRKIRTGTKQAKIIEMLQRPEGASINQISEICGWQNHYADVRIMPNHVGNPLNVGVLVATGAA